MRKEFVTLSESFLLHEREDANLLLTKPLTGIFAGVAIIKFTSRYALESFNKKANLNAVIKTKVSKNCALYRHQEEVI